MTQPTTPSSPSLESVKDKLREKAEQAFLDFGNLSEALTMFVNHETGDLGGLGMKADHIVREAKGIIALLSTSQKEAQSRK